MKWKNTDKRFVAFFDILGFKDMVLKNSHIDILDNLDKLQSVARDLESTYWDEEMAKKSKIKILKNQTKSITFSDSIIFFSQGDTLSDIFKILYDSWGLYRAALENRIAIKGAISFGEITVDFDKSLFFGQAIIDSYLLHEDLHMLGIILDHNAENKINSFDINEMIYNSLSLQKVKMKFGLATHTMLSMSEKEFNEITIKNLEKLYSTTSGKPRIYIDNSIEFYKNRIKIKSDLLLNK